MNNLYFDIRRNQTRKMANSINDVEKKKSQVVFEKYTVDQALENIGYGRFQRKLAILSGGSFGNTSMQLFFILTTISKLKEELEFSNQSSLVYNQTLTIFFLGQILGGLFWSFVGKKYGRSKAFLFSSVVTSISLLLSPFMSAYTLVLISRFFIGIGLGSAITVDFQMFLEFTLITKIQFSHLSFIVYWIISGAILSNLISWILIPLIGMEFTTLAFAIPSVIITYLKYKWKHESPRYLVKEHKMYSAADVLYNMSEMNNTKIPSGTLVINLDEQNDISNSKIELCFKYSKQLRNTIYILLNIFTAILTFSTNIIYISTLKSHLNNNTNKPNDENDTSKTIFMNEHFSIISFLWSISNLFTLPIVILAFNKLNKYQKHFTMVISLFVLSLCTIIMGFSTSVISVSIISIPILISTEVCCSLIYNHIIENFIPISKSAAFSLIGYSIPIYSIIIVLVESFVLDIKSNLFSTLVIISGFIGIGCNIYNMYGFEDIIERKSENGKLSLDEQESGSLIGQSSSEYDDNIDCIIEE